MCLRVKIGEAHVLCHNAALRSAAVHVIDFVAVIAFAVLSAADVFDNIAG